MKISIRSLHAVKCGPLRDVVINFVSEGAHPTNVLAGANGSGKTTALEIITALFDLIPHHSDIGLFRAEFGFNNNLDRPKTTEETLLRIDFAEMEIAIDGVPLTVGYSATTPTIEDAKKGFLFYPSQTRDDQLGVHAGKHVGLIEDLERRIVRAEREELPFTFSTKDALSDSREYLPSILFFPAYRMIKPNKGVSLAREQTRYEWVYRYENPSDFSHSIDSYLLWLEYALPEEYGRVIRFLDSLDLGGKRFGIRRSELKGLVTTQDGQKHFLEYLSSGEQHLIVALLQLARRLTPNSIVLIDEIENALHPAYQHLFAELLTRMQTIVPFQLIVTTHAPAIVDAFGTEAVRLLPVN